MFDIHQNPKIVFAWFEFNYESQIFKEVPDFWIPL